MPKNTFEVSGHEVVAVLTLSRPDCLDIEGKHALLDALALLADRPNLRALIINASGPQAWLVNVAELVEMNPSDARSFSHAGHRLADAIASLPAPVIAAVDAAALASCGVSPVFPRLTAPKESRGRLRKHRC